MLLYWTNKLELPKKKNSSLEQYLEIERIKLFTKKKSNCCGLENEFIISHMLT